MVANDYSVLTLHLTITTFLLIQTKIVSFVLHLSSANAIKFDWFEIYIFFKELNCFLQEWPQPVRVKYK